MSEPQIRHACVWFGVCSEPAIKLRWDGFAGKKRPACAMHCRGASPFELYPLVEDAKDKAS